MESAPAAAHRAHADRTRHLLTQLASCAGSILSANRAPQHKWIRDRLANEFDRLQRLHSRLLSSTQYWRGYHACLPLSFPSGNRLCTLWSSPKHSSLHFSKKRSIANSHLHTSVGQQLSQV